jgi:multidrug resistance efflux pump
MAPQVAGQVVSLAVTDNQAVKQGDLLLQIDPRVYQVKLDEARAELAAARQPTRPSESPIYRGPGQGRAGASGRDGR